VYTLRKDGAAMNRLKNFWLNVKENWLWFSICAVAILTIGLLLADWLRPVRFAPPPYRYFQIDGVQYRLSSHDEGRRFLFRKIEVAGHITSTIPYPDDVQKDDQTNFGCVGAPYAVVDGKMMIKLYGKWYTGIPREKQ